MVSFCFLPTYFGRPFLTILGTIASLKNVKKDVSEMRKDTECGMAFEGWADFEAGDHVQCYEETHEKRHL